MSPRNMSLTFAIAVAISLLSYANAEPRAPIPAAKVDATLAAKRGKQTAVFAGGCFWGTQSVFERVKGVLKTTAGYAGGSAHAATYDQVMTETTGHAESVEIIYDPAQITFFASSFPWRTIPHNSIDRARMWERRIGLPSFILVTSRSKLRLHIFRSSTTRRFFPGQSSRRLPR